MKNNNYQPVTFSLRALLAAAVPAYIFPTGMSFLSGFFLHKKELMQASYTTIGLSSLLATICSFILLWQCDARGLFVQNQSIRSSLIILLMMGMGLLCTYLLQLPSERFNIIFSAFLGAAIVTIRQQVKNNKDEKN
ncbi:hypothetical protein [Chitinophaga nivalis]|uniref:Uncharacterized protein n=1 Tax=Chitinophaga nivalis TaxID=2991709 RepID=A0ABT3IJN6_9BACT|nr:hypothetical protein [Chitinophaga nivalis]MCW3466178.1 hypothetical protein [Chitinophaga nivalis]MCW3484131.1 hypothetical protein [Chitinophaga nivalis]